MCRVLKLECDSSWVWQGGRGKAMGTLIYLSYCAYKPFIFQKEIKGEHGLDLLSPYDVS